MNVSYKYPVWFKTRVYLHAIISGVVLLSLPYLFGPNDQAVSVSVLTIFIIIWASNVVLYIKNLDSKSNEVVLGSGGISINKCFIKWQEIESINTIKDGDQSLLLLVPFIAPKLANGIKVTCINNKEYFVYSALNKYDEFVASINKHRVM